MKKIAIISNIPITADDHKDVLNRIFSNVSIKVVPISESCGSRIDADAALVTATDIVPYAQKYLRPETVIVQGSYTLLKEQLEKIKQLERLGNITVVHENRRATMTRLTLLQRLGIPREHLRAWYPGLKEEALTGQIISFSSAALPKGVTPALQISGRRLSVTSIFELALGLGVQDITSMKEFSEYCSLVCTQFRPSVDDLPIGDFNAMVGNEVPKKGLVAFTQSMSIFYCDEYVSSLVGSTVQDLIGKHLFEAFPFLRSCKIHTGDQDQEQIVVHSGETYTIKLNLVLQTGRETGYLYISDYWVEEQRQMQLRRQVSGSEAKAKYSFRDIVGSSPALIECKNIAYRMAYSNSNILITGATGVGKELFAQSIHNASERRNQPFIAVNCDAIVESLLESELFGYEKGAFTGASKNGKQGLFELAHKGTLFLDEIGEMPLHLQVRLLRVLQEKEVVRVGGNQVIMVDVRVIAATNQDIPSMIQRKEFRSDLFYRLNVLPLYIPPLSSRKEDIYAAMRIFSARTRRFLSVYAGSKRADDALFLHGQRKRTAQLRRISGEPRNLRGESIRSPILHPKRGSGSAVQHRHKNLPAKRDALRRGRLRADSACNISNKYDRYRRRAQEHPHLSQQFGHVDFGSRHSKTFGRDGRSISDYGFPRPRRCAFDRKGTLCFEKILFYIIVAPNAEPAHPIIPIYFLKRD